MKLINPATTRNYTLLADRGSDSPTVFVQRRLTREQMLEYAARSPITVAQSVALSAIMSRAKKENRKLTKAEQKQMDAVEPKSFRDVSKTIDAFAYVVSVGTVEIKNLLDEKGKPMKITPEKFAHAAPGEVVRELGESLLEFSTLAEDAKKN